MMGFSFKKPRSATPSSNILSLVPPSEGLFGWIAFAIDPTRAGLIQAAAALTSDGGVPVAGGGGGDLLLMWCRTTTTTVQENGECGERSGENRWAEV
ncbi:uncharacterized protein EAF01_010645 [Botrytis porri]|uniref:uncharacterized protein n=1 Tax=Botrytis porri TaxID=87229 RepID=UPI0019018D61|nr:uncharacterized protein EAF01_010645 [Botrytis porri]KAF7890836.1 hypothetical protein EAF01_010645 [Botrytis porri]